MPEVGDEDIITVTFDTQTDVTTITIPVLHSQTGKPTVITIDPNVPINTVMGIVRGIING